MIRINQYLKLNRNYLILILVFHGMPLLRKDQFCVTKKVIFGVRNIKVRAWKFESGSDFRVWEAKEVIFLLGVRCRVGSRILTLDFMRKYTRVNLVQSSTLLPSCKASSSDLEESRRSKERSLNQPSRTFDVS